MSNYFNIKNDPILNPPGNVSLGSVSHPYENIYTTGNLVVGNTSFSSASLNVPKISAIVYSGDDTAVDTAGSQTVTLTGSGFVAGARVIVNQTAASVVTVVNDSTLSFVTPALSTGTYILYVVNPDGGTAILVPGIEYSGVPTWSTASGSLGSVYETASFNNTLTATGDAPVTYSLYSGTLPTGATLNANGTISGTSVVTNSPTTYTFTIRVTDAQKQDTDRTFSITVNPDVVTWSSPIEGAAYSISADAVITPVTLSASAASGQTVNYTANTLPDGVSLTGNIISGTPTTVSNVSTLLTATSLVTNRSATRTISWVVNLGVDTFFPYVTTLLSANVVTKPFNCDASTNNFNITVNGGTRPNNFNSYTPGYYSAQFDGTGDYLSLTKTGGLGAGSFTIEFWYYPTATTGMIFNSRTTGTGGDGIDITTTLNTTTSGAVLFAAQSITLNAWTHVAIVRNVSSMVLYINGTQASTITNSTNFSGTSFLIGGSNVGNTGYLTGYMSNFRVTNTAVYTSNFTPNTTPLTAISGTSLLTCQSNRFIDNSANNFTITKNGDTKVSSFIPYTPNSSYSTYGSTYFNGTDSSLTAPANAVFQLTGDFTVEAWIYPTALSGTANMIIGSAAGSQTDWFGLIPTQLQIVISNSSTNWNYAFTTNTWYHVAVARSGTNLTAYVNGVSIGTQTRSEQFLNTGSGVMIGRYGFSAALWFTGYISDARIVKGTAVYTANFTPPTAPLTAITNTSLLTCQTNQPVNNNVFLDNSTNNFLITRAGNTTQGTFSPYGENWSNYFDGAGDSLTTPAPNGTIGTGDFTMEAYVYYTKSTFDAYNDIIYSRGTMLCLNSGNLRLYGLGVASTYTLPINTWVHVAATRQNGIVKLFANGVQVQQFSDSTSVAWSNPVYIGSYTEGMGEYWFGYISNVRLVAGTAVYTSNFTPSTTPLQPVPGTVLLTCKDPNLVDDGPSNLTVTRNGDVSVQKFGPFAGTTLPTPYYGAYFDGTGDYLSFASPVVAATGNFTIEGWFNLTTAVGSRRDIFYQSSASTHGVEGRLIINLETSGAITAFVGGTGAPGLITSTTTVIPNVWYHFAYVRNSNTFSLYINGIREGTQPTSSISIAQEPLLISYNPLQTPVTYWTGYLSNIRVVNGTALYTENFTPPTSPLTAISGTSLLTCQSNTFVDNSTNNFAITVNGNTRPTSFNPFTVTYSTKQSYTPSVFGGSMYFDGTGDYLSIASGMDVGSTDFTVEAWVYPTAWTVEYTSIFSTRATNATSGATDVWVLGAHNTGYPYVYSGAFQIQGSAGQVPLRTWTHLSVSRSGSNMRLFVNGIRVQTATTSQNYTQTAGAVGANRDGSEAWTGYISDLKLTKGQALYTSNFVPQNQPLTAVKNTTLLLNGTGASVYDSSTNAVFETVGDAKLSTTTVKFSGSTSMYFDGTGDYLTILKRPTTNFGSGDFTIECWYYITSLGNYPILGRGPSDSDDELLILILSNGQYYVDWGGVTGTYIQGGSAVTNAWTHFAFVRSGTSIKVYTNGTQSVSGSLSGALTNNYNIYIGMGRNGTFYFNGYMSDYRITCGYARYTSNFTVPTTPFVAK